MRCSNCQTELSPDATFCSRCGASAGPIDDSASTQTMMAAAGAPPVLGAVLAGKFRLLEVLGRGGMGIVYKAEDTKLHRSVALKFLPPEHRAESDARERFFMEARAAAALSHPHICTIHEIHDEGEAPFIAMEYIAGQTLRSRIKHQPLPVAEVVRLAIQVGEALAAAHEKGIIHRDIKSANIMVSGPESGHAVEAKVMDFGLAKVSGETLNTREGTTLGTAAYMSPEQACSDNVDQRTDLWSLGVVLYEMLSGKLPFSGDLNASILYAVVHQDPRPLKDIQPDVPPELDRIVYRALKRDLSNRYQSAGEMVADLRQYQQRVQAEALGTLAPRPALKPGIVIAAAVCLLPIIAAGAWYLNRQSKIHWAREQALPEITRELANSQFASANSQFASAYKLARQAQKYIPQDPDVLRALAASAFTFDVTTDPPGARVSIQDYSSPGDPWRFLGATPIKSATLPRSYYCLKIEKPGYETVLAAAPTAFNMEDRSTIERTLDPQGKLPPGMVRVRASTAGNGPHDDFFIDRYEVTDKQFKQFVDAGGYRERKYWSEKFLQNGKELTWEQAMAQLVDQTGRPGPSTWQAGDYPKGQDDYPVSGVSWYEAAAYAAYAGKTLPTVSHWLTALGLAGNARSLMARLSNFKGRGPAAVGAFHGMSAFGAFDMAGNAREWCWNATREGRAFRGGSSEDPNYMVANISQAPPLDRSPRNGFRCALYPEPAKISAALLAPMESTGVDFYKMTPVSDAVFQAYADQFSYDKKPLNPRVEWRTESPDWIQERIVVDAAYGNEKLPMHLFLPRHGSPPYQTVVYFPSSGSVFQPPAAKDVEHYAEFEYVLSFLVKNGRAVLYPIYKGTFDRSDPALLPIHAGATTRQYTEYVTQIVKDFRVSVDYLQTRPEIDGSKLAFEGFSWGSTVAPIVLSVEKRINTGVLVLGGLVQSSRPEASPINYVTRVKTPMLLLNGRYDMTLPYETSAKPLFDLLGTPLKDKVQQVYDTDHSVPHNELVKETLTWLDRYLGPIK